MTIKIDEFKSFFGFLRYENHEIKITFQAKIDNQTGVLTLNFNEIPFSNKSRFIEDIWQGNTYQFGSFELSGQTDDGLEFHSKSLNFSSVKITPNSNLILDGECLHSTISKNVDDKDTSFIRSRVCGFKSFRLPETKTLLGNLQIQGSHKNEPIENITGYFEVAKNFSEKLHEDWEEKTLSFINHLLIIFSFSSACRINVPITETLNDGKYKIDVFLQNKQTASAQPVIHHLHQKLILEAAYNSYFAPKLTINSLYSAVEWFCMQSLYKESMLINAMTALENIIDSNLDDNKKLYFKKKTFNKLAADLAPIVHEKFNECTDIDSYNLTINELKSKLNELNRIPLLPKITLIADEFKVCIDDIKIKINNAKSARDKIVHRGLYAYIDSNNENELYEHMLIIRETVVRIILASINYQGDYLSYVDGYHTCKIKFKDNHLG